MNSFAKSLYKVLSPRADFPRNVQWDNFTCAVRCSQNVLEWYEKATNFNTIKRDLRTTVTEGARWTGLNVTFGNVAFRLNIATSHFHS